jgi:hypothetical protein
MSSDEPRESRVEAGRDQLLLISWGLFGYLAFLSSVGTVLPNPTLAASSITFFTVLFGIAAAFLRWRKSPRAGST